MGDDYWIPVKERTPNSCYYVLMANYIGDVNIGWYEAKQKQWFYKGLRDEFGEPIPAMRIKYWYSWKNPPIGVK